MATLFVYNSTVGDFYISPLSLPCPDRQIAWTDEAFMRACSELCTKFELRLIRSFVPIREGHPVRFSAHHAGLAGDFALLSPCRNVIARQNEIRRWCVSSGLFSYVRPQYRTPLWIHAEIAVAPACSPFVPYPVLFPGNIGVHCFILQRCLNCAGYHCLLNGRFSADTQAALGRFCLDGGLPFRGTVDGACWRRLMEAASSRGIK